MNGLCQIYLILAVDGTDDVYGRNRHPADLREVEGRIGDFLALKLARDSDLHVTVQLLDLPLARDPLGILSDTLAREHYPLVGIGALTAQYEGALGVIRHLRTCARSSRIVLGGPHASGRPDAVLRDFGADFVIAGEGEGSLLRLVYTVEGIPVDMAPGLSDYYTPHFATEGLTYRRLVWLRLRGYLGFYLTPKRMWRILKDVANPQFIELYLNPLRRMLQMLFGCVRGGRGTAKR